MISASSRTVAAGRLIGRQHCHRSIGQRGPVRVTAASPSPLRTLSGSSGASGPSPASEDKKWHASRSDRSESVGLPDWIEHWSRDNFKRFGYVLGASPVVLAGLEAYPASVAAAAVAAGYWKVGLDDMDQKGQTIRRNFPVLGNMRYLLEMIRPEIRQYFVEGDHEAVPFSRAQVRRKRQTSHLFLLFGSRLFLNVAPLTPPLSLIWNQSTPDIKRTTVYERAKNADCTMPFGTRRDVNAVGYEWINHSMYPTHLDEQRVLIGGNNPDCKQPHSASLLNISAMSYGALSERAILALSSGAKIGNFYHNTGEGGMSRFHKEGGGDLTWNVGTGYFGCGAFDEDGKRVFDPEMFKENSQYASMIEIKLSQGAKPAHGGLLPKSKITKEIAEARNLPFPATQNCDSPNRHSAFSNPVEMCEFISQLRSLSNGKPVGIKLCLGHSSEFVKLVRAFVDTGVHPDFITVDGSEGGTGAAPPEFSNSIGTPLNEALSFVHATLVGAGLRDPNDKSKSKVAVIASGKIISGFSMFKAFALGADVANCARGFLFSLGCIQALKCNTNTCPTGITTQDPDLAWGLDPAAKKVRVANFHKATVDGCVEIMEAVGVDSWSQVGPRHVYRRVGNDTSCALDEVYERLKVDKGALLEGTGPVGLQNLWEGGMPVNKMRAAPVVQDANA